MPKAAQNSKISEFGKTLLRRSNLLVALK